MSSPRGADNRAEIAVPAVLLAVLAWGIGPLMVRDMSVGGYTTAMFRMWLGAPAMYLASRWWGNGVTWKSLKACVVPGCFFGASMVLDSWQYARHQLLMQL